MDTFLTLFLALSGAVIVTFVMNLIQLDKDTRKLRAEGKTPLHGRNIIVICVAAVAELWVCFGLVKLYQVISLEQTRLVVFVEFVLAYLLRNVGAYLAAWGLWSIFVRADRKRLQKQIEENKEKAL